jgi:hypothetical protein
LPETVTDEQAQRHPHVENTETTFVGRDRGGPLHWRAFNHRLTFFILKDDISKMQIEE